jgi:hypothetical protein
MELARFHDLLRRAPAGGRLRCGQAVGRRGHATAHVAMRHGMCRKGVSLPAPRCRQTISGSVSAILPHNGQQTLSAPNSS